MIEVEFTREVELRFDFVDEWNEQLSKHRSKHVLVSDPLREDS